MNEQGEPQRPEGPARGSGGPVDVFLSYRRDDAEAYAGRLYDSLAQRFGDEHVFMDIDSIDPGSDFAETIRDKVGACDVLLAVIGPDWVTVTEAGGRRRLDAPGDWVRAEIQTALRLDVKVIPVLVNDAEMPLREQLPKGITRLAGLQAFKIGPRWRPDVALLADSIEAAAAARSAPAVARPAEEQTATPPDPGSSEPVTVPAHGTYRAAPPSEPVSDRDADVGPDPPRRRILAMGAIGAATLVALVVIAFLAFRGGGGPGQPVERSVAVSGRATWTDTGVDVEQGADVTVATGGQVSTDVHFASQDQKVIGPDGTANTVGDRSYKSVTFEANHGALIWRIGSDGPTFPLGADGTVSAPAAGRLFLGINDLEPCNNGGSFTATIGAGANEATFNPLPTSTTVPAC